jgi:hypothetical protein
MLVACRLIVAHRSIERSFARESFVNSGSAQLGVVKRVLDSLSRDEVLVVTRVSHQSPALTEWLAEMVRHRHAGEAFLAFRMRSAKLNARSITLWKFPSMSAFLASNSLYGLPAMMSVWSSFVGRAANEQ